MISYLRGKIKYFNIDWLILDVGGVGYKIQLKTEGSLKIGDLAEYYIYHHIREDRSELYGFNSLEELNMFELLLTVNGVGPKMAANITGNSDNQKLSSAIAKGDPSFFLTISGVGKKLATKIILELKNKINSEDMDILTSSELSTDILDAMESLGYTKKEIYPQLSKIPSEIDSTEKKVKWLLKNFKK